MKLIFLDIDGVLNTHSPFPNGYNGIEGAPRMCLNALLGSEPDAKLVISSAWRYLVLNGSMTAVGFERLLLTHGIDAHERVHGITAADPDTFENRKTIRFDAEQWRIAGLRFRVNQIMDYVAIVKPSGFVVLDDLPLENCPNFVRVDDAVGLRINQVSEARDILARGVEVREASGIIGYEVITTPAKGE